jgi:hypothetical protein
MRVSPSLLGGAAFATLLATATGCGGSGYQYVENDELGVYARLPGDWAVYDERALFPDDSEREREEQAARSWFRTFDGSDNPSADRSTQPGGTEPTGFVRVLALPVAFREQVNLSALRGLGLGDPTADPVAAAAEDPNVAILSDEPVEFDGGYHGVHTVFSLVVGDDKVVIDQTTLLDSTSSVAYLFQVSCSEDCYFETHKDQIADIVDSWTIQEVKK